LLFDRLFFQFVVNSALFFDVCPTGGVGDGKTIFDR